LQELNRSIQVALAELQARESRVAMPRNRPVNGDIDPGAWTSDIKLDVPQTGASISENSRLLRRTFSVVTRA